MKKLTTEEFINRAKKIHGNTFCYDLTDYLGMLKPVKIICKEHGVFIKRAQEHIREKQGCPKCSHNYPLTTEEFVSRSQEKYGNQYSLVSKFNGMKHNVILSCRDHGEFKINKAEGHFQRNGGCPVCAANIRRNGLKTGNISKSEKQWLDDLNIPIRQHTIKIDNEYFIVDGFDPKTNTVYEFYGSFWHGNPEKYDPDQINSMKNMTFGKLYQNTLLRENKIRKKFNIVVKWD